MSKKLQAVLDKDLSKIEINWNLAISEAERQIEVSKGKIKELTMAISYFSELRDKESSFAESTVKP